MEAKPPNVVKGDPVLADPPKLPSHYNADGMTPKSIKSILAIALFTGVSGCVERTITITSEPAGALVYLNDREIGRTPVDVEFIHYGEYDVRLVKDGYEPQLTSGDANAPIWDLPGPDFFAEIFPAKFRSDITWHYVLEPVRDDPDALIERAREIRSRFEAGPVDAESQVPADRETSQTAVSGE